MTDDTQAKLLSAVTTLTDEVQGLKGEVCDLKSDVREMREIVDAWGAVKTAGKFLKWLGGVVAAIAVIVTTIKLSLAGIVGGVR